MFELVRVAWEPHPLSFKRQCQPRVSDGETQIQTVGERQYILNFWKRAIGIVVLYGSEINT